MIFTIISLATDTKISLPLAPIESTAANAAFSLSENYLTDNAKIAFVMGGFQSLSG